LEDVKTLSCDYDQFTRTSDHFDKLLECFEQLIKSGKAYADDTDPKEMKKERDQQIESKNRNNSEKINSAMKEKIFIF
jgi:glutamyl/glutaminyl-tRNA synthetase